MKRMAALLLLLLIPALLSVAAGETRIMQVSDIHYLSPSLFEGSGDYFPSVLARGDGKAAQYSGELLDALLAEARHQQPDLLLITGDLTFNGEKASHQELSAALRGLQEEGIPVLVIPGNHDINNANAIRYGNGAVAGTDNVTPGEFQALWQGMLADDMTGPGASGLVRLGEDLWLILGDYSVYENTVATYGMATAAHLSWLEEVTAAVKEAGVTLISCSHQNLLPHTAFAASSMRVVYGDKVAALLADAGCRVNLSGHMHMQNILPGKVTDIAVGSWSVYPFTYGMVTVSDEGDIRYEARSLCEEHLAEEIRADAEELFAKATTKGMQEELEALDVPEEERSEMADYALEFNTCYFIGTLSRHSELLTDPARSLWARYTGSSTFALYIETLLNEPIYEGREWSSTEK